MDKIIATQEQIESAIKILEQEIKDVKNNDKKFIARCKDCFGVNTKEQVIKQLEYALNRYVKQSELNHI